MGRGMVSMRVHAYAFQFFISPVRIRRMLRNVGGFSPLGLPGSILGTSDEELPRRPANQTRQDRQPYLTDLPFVTDHFSLTDLETVRP